MRRLGICAYCGQTFAGHGNRRYCNSLCAYLKRHPEEDER